MHTGVQMKNVSKLTDARRASRETTGKWSDLGKWGHIRENRKGNCMNLSNDSA